MIEPIVGSVVWLYGASGVNYTPPGRSETPKDQPFGARIVYVWSNRLVNVVYEDHSGDTLRLQYVVLLQDDEVAPTDEPYLVWPTQTIKPIDQGSMQYDAE